MRSSLLIAAIALGVSAVVAEAQLVESRIPAGRTRAELEESVARADSAHREGEASRIRLRLRNGDFEVGDRVVVTLEGTTAQKTDTLTVQADRVLRLDQPLGDLNLKGMLRTELPDSVQVRASRFLKNVVVHVVPLLRISISGAVRAPGFYYVRADLPLSDVIMRNGGPDQSSDLGSTVVRRDTQLLWAADEVRIALRDGVTLDALNLEPGDEIVVGKHGGEAWTRVLQFGLPVLSAVLIQLVLRR